MKKCLFCGEEIQDVALKCKHCGEWLNVESSPDSKEIPEVLQKLWDFIDEGKLKKHLSQMPRKPNLYHSVISEVEKALITLILRETEGNQLSASKILGINRNTLRQKIIDYKIKM